MNDFALYAMILGLNTLTLGFLAWVIWLVSRRRRERQAAEIELRGRLLDRLQSPEEISRFLESEGGRHFFDVGLHPAKAGRGRFLTAVSFGLVFTFVGLAFGVMAWVETSVGALWPAVLIGSLGLALLSFALLARRLAGGPGNGGSAA